MLLAKAATGLFLPVKAQLLLCYAKLIGTNKESRSERKVRKTKGW